MRRWGAACSCRRGRSSGSTTGCIRWRCRHSRSYVAAAAGGRLLPLRFLRGRCTLRKPLPGDDLGGELVVVVDPYGVAVRARYFALRIVAFRREAPCRPAARLVELRRSAATGCGRASPDRTLRYSRCGRRGGAPGFSSCRTKSGGVSRRSRLRYPSHTSVSSMRWRVMTIWRLRFAW